MMSSQSLDLWTPRREQKKLQHSVINSKRVETRVLTLKELLRDTQQRPGGFLKKTLQGEKTSEMGLKESTARIDIRWF